MTAGPGSLPETIAGPAGPLEAMLEDPGSAARQVAVVCHPHPLFGGTMHNKVVTTVARALRDEGVPTVRFNFRGVGASAGSFDSGNGETADAAAVADWCSTRWPGCDLVIAGFSFGAYVALRLAQSRPASLLITIAPPVGNFDFSGLAAPQCPWLVLQGDADEVVDARRVVDWAESLEPRPRLTLLPGVGHFFHGRLHELRDTVRGAIRSD
jgi:alpha/beta superfamily hydrolase